MLLYQVIIMLVVVIVICLIAYVFRIKNHLALAACILGLALLGSGSLCLVQSIFSTHYTSQKIDVSMLKNLKVTPEQKKNLSVIFPDYSGLYETETTCSGAIDKTFHVKSRGADSQITVTIYSFDSDDSAQEFYSLSQKFYDNKNYLPPDGQLSMNTKGLSHRYITSYIKSTYPDYTDLLYLPSKIVYLSDVMVLDNDVIISVHERSDRPFSNKEPVIQSILKALGDPE